MLIRCLMKCVSESVSCTGVAAVMNECQVQSQNWIGPIVHFGSYWLSMQPPPHERDETFHTNGSDAETQRSCGFSQWHNMPIYTITWASQGLDHQPLVLYWLVGARNPTLCMWSRYLICMICCWLFCLPHFAFSPSIWSSPVYGILWSRRQSRQKESLFFNCIKQRTWGTKCQYYYNQEDEVKIYIFYTAHQWIIWNLWVPKSWYGWRVSADKLDILTNKTNRCMNWLLFLRKFFIIN